MTINSNPETTSAASRVTGDDLRAKFESLPPLSYTPPRLVADDAVELDEHRYFGARIAEGRSTCTQQAALHRPKELPNFSFAEWVKNTFDTETSFYTQFSNYRATVLLWDPALVKEVVKLDLFYSDPTLDFTVFGDYEDVLVIHKWIRSMGFFEPPREITWVFESGNGTSTVQRPLSKKPTLEGAYPWIPGGDPGAYIDDYLEGDEPVLLLIGAPGTGKSSFIKELVARSKYPTTITFSPRILATDAFFVQFMTQGDVGLLVVEDADDLLTPRTSSSGNLDMPRLLNISDGPVSMSGKKIVFSTNLTSTAQVDSALLRPGRCFDVLTTRNLTREEALNVRAKLGITEELIAGNSFSLAEATKYRENRRTLARRAFGFTNT